MKKNVWLRSILSALVSGGAGGVSTGLATLGISPEHFNFQQPALLLKVCAASVVISAALGVANFLKQSPLPAEEGEGA